MEEIMTKSGPLPRTKWVGGRVYTFAWVVATKKEAKRSIDKWFKGVRHYRLYKVSTHVYGPGPEWACYIGSLLPGKKAK